MGTHITQNVKKTILERQLLVPGETVIVAVSGGPDSLALMHLLATLAPELNVSIHVVHIHHGLRPEASAEALVVKKWSIARGLPVTVCRVNVGAIVQKMQCSIQVAARVARYQALLRIASRVGATVIATGHHRDDRVETVLLRLLAGSGLDGLKGIPISRVLTPTVRVVRPLFMCSRIEIEAYCEELGFTPLLDPSNQKLVYARNRVRLRLLPFLEQEFGMHIRRTLAKTAELLADDSALLETETQKAYRNVAFQGEPHEVVLQLDSLGALPQALQRRVIRQALWTVGATRVGLVHLDQVLAVTHSSSPSARCSLSGDIVAHREYNRLYLGQRKPKKEVESVGIPLQIPGKTYLPWCDRCLEAQLISVTETHLPLRYKEEAYLAYETLIMPLSVRPRLAGDRIQLLGSPGSRKLKKILADKKIPQDLRSQVPLVVSEGVIVWVAGVDIAQANRVGPTTKQVLHLKLLEFNKDGV